MPFPHHIVIPVFVSVNILRKFVDVTTWFIRSIDVPVAPAPVWFNRISPLAPESVDEDPITNALPVVRPLSVILRPFPVVRDAEVMRASTAVVAAVAAKSSNVPVVVPVSTPVDVIRRSEPPDATTVVVWLMLIAAPVVKPVSVRRNDVPAAFAVDERSTRVPVVVDVSIDVDDTRKSDPPLAMTDVV